MVNTQWYAAQYISPTPLLVSSILVRIHSELAICEHIFACYVAKYTHTVPGALINLCHIDFAFVVNSQ